MNNIVEKVKQYFSSNFGKLAAIIAGFSFVITLILSVSYRNRIDISLLKAIFSAIITIAILFLLGTILKKYLGDVIDEADTNSNMDIDYNAIDDNNSSNNTSSSDTDDTPFTPDLSLDLSAPKPLNIDKNTKPNYKSSGDDIGDIVFSKPSTAQSAASYTSSSSMFPDKKVTSEEMEREVREDPEKVAKAVRTMIAKDEKDDK
ncbi:hypothetical protein [Brachyspira sp. G79]|uniref:hypothetical protein n=1 Tax=Brachyspira sp. G79 TaxID=1358104 RepID=UPI000BBCB663|nr:hypothetical protein [Brachyspira sp. G79]PCG19205.1 hypothetical protein KQ44_03450 [Brachyspira sp. G79]